MTKKQAEQKIRELNRNLAHSTLSIALSLLDIKSIDLKGYEDSYSLPKMCINAAQERMRKQYFPLFSLNDDEAERIEALASNVPFPEDK